MSPTKQPLPFGRSRLTDTDTLGPREEGHVTTSPSEGITGGPTFQRDTLTAKQALDFTGSRHPSTLSQVGRSQIWGDPLLLLAAKGKEKGRAHQNMMGVPTLKMANHGRAKTHPTLNKRSLLEPRSASTQRIYSKLRIEHAEE